MFGVGTALWRVDAFVYLLATWQILSYSIMSVSAFALCMDVSWPRVAATQFTAYMALANLSTTIGYLLGGYAFEQFEYDQLYLLAAAAQVVLLVPLWFVDAGEARRRLPLPPGSKLGPLAIVTGVVFLVAVGVVPLWIIL